MQSPWLSCARALPLLPMWRRLSWPVSLLVCALLLSGQAPLPDPPVPDLVVSYDQASHSVLVRNREHAPYTLDFSFPEFENTVVDCGRPCLKVAPPGRTTRVLSFRRKQAGLAWKARYEYFYRIGDYRARPETSFVYQLPFARGAGFPVGQGYNGSFSHTAPNNYALDFIMPEGSPVHAAREGTVVWTVAQYSEGGIADRFRRHANHILVLHRDGSLALYTHLRKNGVVVRPGQRVPAGALLGYSGNTGYSARPHLHFQVQANHDGRNLQTLPTRFRTTRGIEILKERQLYTRP